jgi:hypothetical protein
MVSRTLAIFRPLLVLLMGLYLISTPPTVSAAKSGSGGACGACAWGQTPCGGGQANMDEGCRQSCGGGTASGCTAHDTDCAPAFADGWWCGPA